MDSLNYKVLQKETKEALEIEKLKHDITLLKNQLGDYNSNKRRAKLALIIAAVALLMQLLSQFKTIILSLFH